MQLADAGPFMDKKAFRDSNLHSYFYTACYRHLCSSRGNLGWQKFKLIITIMWRIHKTDVHNILHCRPTNYELLRWLVETLSRDWALSNDGRFTTIYHRTFSRKVKMSDDWSSDIFTLRENVGGSDSLDGVSTYLNADVVERTQLRSPDCW